MSSHFSQGSEESTSDSNGPDTESSGNAKRTPQPGESSNGIGRESRSRMMCERSTLTGLKPKSRDDWKGVSRKEATQSTSFAEASRSHVKTSPLRENERDLPVNDQDCSSRQPESLTLFSDPEDGCSLRTFPDFFPQTVEGISESFSRRWPTSGFTTSPGECWTADTSECPKGGGEFSFLPDVLEATVPSRFFLSRKAAAGILRRAEKRGRELPKHLHEALQSLACQLPVEGRKTT